MLSQRKPLKEKKASQKNVVSKRFVVLKNHDTVYG